MPMVLRVRTIEEHRGCPDGSSLFGGDGANVQHIVSSDEGVSVLVLELTVDILFCLMRHL